MRFYLEGITSLAAGTGLEVRVQFRQTHPTVEARVAAVVSESCHLVDQAAHPDARSSFPVEVSRDRLAIAA